MFDPELFRTALATGPMNANNAIEEAEEVMERVVDACDATEKHMQSASSSVLVE